MAQVGNRETALNVQVWVERDYDLIPARRRER